MILLLCVIINATLIFAQVIINRSEHGGQGTDFRFRWREIQSTLSRIDVILEFVTQ